MLVNRPLVRCCLALFLAGIEDKFRSRQRPARVRRECIVRAFHNRTAHEFSANRDTPDSAKFRQSALLNVGTELPKDSAPVPCILPDSGEDLGCEPDSNTPHAHTGKFHRLAIQNGKAYHSWSCLQREGFALVNVATKRWCATVGRPIHGKLRGAIAASELSEP